MPLWFLECCVRYGAPASACVLVQSSLGFIQPLHPLFPLTGSGQLTYVESFAFGPLYSSGPGIAFSGNEVLHCWRDN